MLEQILDKVVMRLALVLASVMCPIALIQGESLSTAIVALVWAVVFAGLKIADALENARS